MNPRNNTLLWAAAGIGTALALRSVIRSRRKHDFRGKTALITGGSRGLGLVLARRLLGEGMRVAICARDAAELERARADLVRKDNPSVLTVPCDVTDAVQIDNLLRTVRGRFGAVNVLINNAGVIEVGPMEMMLPADYDQAMRTHFWAPFYMTRAVLPEMQARGEGRIVNIASIGGKISLPHLLPYGASKFALVGFSEGLRSELLKNGIYVTTVCPGLMRTGSIVQADFKSQNRAEYAWFGVGGSTPGFSMGANRAARQIVDACRYGEAEVILGLPAKAAAWFHGLFPGLTADLLAVENRLLPGPGGIGTKKAKGRDSRTGVVSALTALSERAARRNNELPPRAWQEQTVS